MEKSTVIEFRSAGPSRDALTEVIRQEARQLLAEALEAEVETLLAEFQEERAGGRLVRNGYLPERGIQTGIGGVPVRVPRVRDARPRRTTAALPVEAGAEVPAPG